MISQNSLIQGLKQLKNRQPDPFWAEKNKAELKAYFAENFSAETKGLAFSFPRLKPVMVTIVILGVIFISSWGTVYAAKTSLPGDIFYPVKRMAEKARLAFAFNQSEKNVLKAELLSQRLAEVEVLAKRAETDVRAESNLITATKDMHEDVVALKKDIIAQSSSETVKPNSDVIVDKGLLPIQDGKKIVQMVQSENLKEILAETTNLLREKKLATALENTMTVEKKLAEPVATSTPAQVGEKPAGENLKEPVKIQPIIKPEQILKSGPGSVGSSVEQQDFGTGLIREAPLSGGLIREK